MEPTAALNDDIRKHLPSYLTMPQKEALASAFSTYPLLPTDYYISGKYLDEMLQGDCWRSLKILNFETQEKKNASGIILSNSCDIAPENNRDIPTTFVFSPVVKLSIYAETLKKSGIDHERIKAKLDSIRRQEVTSAFYLPNVAGGLGDEYIAFLDIIHTMPMSALNIETENKKRFTLSMVGFYMLLFKLSVHFCRMGENVLREA